MTLVDPPDVLEEGRVGKSPIARVGGTGSISTLGVDAKQAEDAGSRRGPIGFAAAEPVETYHLEMPVCSSVMDRLQEITARAVGVELRERTERVESELRDLGECLCTARDVFVIVDTGGALEVRSATDLYGLRNDG